MNKMECWVQINNEARILTGMLSKIEAMRQMQI